MKFVVGANIGQLCDTGVHSRNYIFRDSDALVARQR